MNFQRFTAQTARPILLCLGLVLSPCAVSTDSSSISDATSLPKKELSQQEFIYTPEEMLSFDVRAFLADSAPHLLDHAERITHWSGRTSISPKILLAALEFESQSVTGDRSELNQSSSDKEKLATRIEGLAIQLAERYYDNLMAQVANPEVQTLNTLIGEELDTRSDKKIKTARDFTDTFYKLFPPTQPSNNKSTTLRQTQSAPAENLLQLPYPVGNAWQTWGGNHTFSGSGGGPRSSLDFRQNRNGFGADTSNIWVSSASSGRVVKHSSCFTEVLASGGWSTTYYHLDNIQVSSGQTVARNTRLANYADNRSQSLCNGGMTNGPHLHFSLKRNGVYVSLDGVTLSGYRVRGGRSNYDSDCNHFWLGEASTKFCDGRPIPNQGVSTPSPDPGPDLSVGAFEVSEQALTLNQPFMISTRVDNLGNMTAPPSKLVLRLSTDSRVTQEDTELKEVETKSLSAGENASYSVSALRLATPGEFWLGACVATVAGETNATNNCSRASAVTVSDETSGFALPSILLLLDDEK